MAKRKTKRKGNRRDHKSTKATMLNRVDTVLKLILSGVTRRRDIFQFVTDSEDINWRVSERTLDLYIARATEWLREQSNIDRMKELGKSLLQCDMLYMNALKVQDYKTCLQIIKERALLSGTRDNKINVELEGSVTLEAKLGGMDDEEIDKIGQEISKRLAQSGVNLQGTGTPEAKKTGRG